MFDKIVIVDQSTTTTVPQLASPDRPRAFIPIFSPTGFGKDSVVKLFNANSQAKLVSSYGIPSMVNTLAPMYYAYEFLRGGGDVYVRRITSKTSTFAHAIIVVKFRDGTGPNIGKAEVMYEIRTLVDATNTEQMIADAEALRDITPDADSYITYPIALLTLKWSGKNGNKFTWRLLPARTLDKQITSKAYQVQINNPTTASPTTVSFTFDDATVLDGQSLYADDIFELQSSEVGFHVLAPYTEFIEKISTYLPAEELESPDLFFGVNKLGEAYPNYVVLDTSVDFTNAGGIPMAAGSDGNFDLSDPARVQNMMARYVESFDEDATQMLLNEYKYYIDYVFDFGAPQEVKDALVAFANQRKTTKVILDSGTQNTTITSLVNARKSGGLSYNNERVNIAGGVGTYIDPNTNKKLTMPLSFFEAYATASHIVTFQKGATPFAGASYTYDNMVAGTYKPAVYDENADGPQQLYDNQINFAMEDINGYQAFHQSTASKSNGALGERNNVQLLHLMVRTCLLEAKAERWNFAEDSDIARYQDRLTQRISTEMEGKLGEFELTAARAGEHGEDRNRVEVAINVRFKYINKGTTFRFTVS